MKRLLAVVTAVSALMIGGTARAAADPPQPIPGESPFVLPGTDTDGPNGYCPFTVLGTIPVNNEQGRLTTEPNGDVVQTYRGHLTVSLQNADTGKTVSYNASGPGSMTTHPDGSYTVDTHGGNLFYTTVKNTYAGPPTVPQVYFSTGHLVFTVAGGPLNGATDPTVAWSLTGRLTDVCAVLAGR